MVTARLRDPDGRVEQAFIEVARVRSSQIEGRIVSDLRLVTRYHRGEFYTLPEAELIDWTIVRADGSEEGNVVGKFLDTYRPRR